MTVNTTMVCSVSGCQTGSAWYKGPKYTLYRFRSDPQMIQSWLDQINRPDFIPNKSSVVCGKHFTEDCFDTSLDSRGRARKRAKLKDNAIPTLFLHPDESGELPSIVPVKEQVIDTLTHYSKSQIFVQRFNFDKTIFTSFSPQFFLTIFLVKSKLSTAKKSKTTTFSRVFHQNFFLTIFLVKSKLSTAKKSKTVQNPNIFTSFSPQKNRQFSWEIKVEFLDKK